MTIKSVLTHIEIILEHNCMGPDAKLLNYVFENDGSTTLYYGDLTNHAAVHLSPSETELWVEWRKEHNMDNTMQDQKRQNPEFIDDILEAIKDELFEQGLDDTAECVKWQIDTNGGGTIAYRDDKGKEGRILLYPSEMNIWLEHRKNQKPDSKEPSETVKRHADICKEINALFERKDHDYGGSFHKSYLEYGMIMACIRLEDKLNRLKQLTKNRAEGRKVQDESVRDTLMDLADYAIMTVMELDDETEEKK